MAMEGGANRSGVKGRGEEGGKEEEGGDAVNGALLG